MGNESSKSKSPGAKVTSALGIKTGPSQTTIQKHMDNAQKSRILQLKSCGLRSVPPSLHELRDVIRNLELSQNQIKELPPTIGGFSLLKQLHLSENLLSELPDEIGALKNLEVLNLQRNMLTSLPDAIAGCYSLRTLNVSSNKFSQFPMSVCYLASLETLLLEQNTITELPTQVSSLNVSELNLNRNRLNSLNADSLAKCAHLKILRVEENCLAKTEFSMELLSSSTVSIICYSGNVSGTEFSMELLSSSTVSIICYSGNVFQEREFQDLPGYEHYQERFTATRRKM
ncbi:hypothetical protein Q1695_010701 [Nippostrongylus brasiliensis]|nr:hypothetical protein Q1695_010701 [Nippostrongylus brasiliensis]